MNEYIIVNKTALLKMREELEKGSAHWDGIYVSDYEKGQIDLIDDIISSQSTPLIPEIEKAWEDGRGGTKVVGNPPFVETRYVNKTSQDYISNLKLV